MAASAAHHPLFFTFKEVVSGNGFLAGIIAKGRVLLAQEEDESWWIYGVQPGGFAASGSTPQEVYAEFRTAFRSILFDFAATSEKYEAFRQQVEGFFAEVNEPQAMAWTEAREAFRMGKIQITEEAIQNLPRDDSKEMGFLALDRLDVGGAVFAPSDNMLDRYCAAA